MEQITGNTAQIEPSGQINLIRSDGSVLKTNQEGTSEYFFNDGDIVLITKDGNIIQQLSDGTRQKLNSDGSLITLLPDETVEVIRREPYKAGSTSSKQQAYPEPSSASSTYDTSSSSAKTGDGGEYAGRALIVVADSKIGDGM